MWVGAAPTAYSMASGGNYTGFGDFNGFNNHGTDEDRIEWLDGTPELDASVFGCVVALHSVDDLLKRRQQPVD